jgi:hypothetical protein
MKLLVKENLKWSTVCHEIDKVHLRMFKLKHEILKFIVNKIGNWSLGRNHIIDKVFFYVDIIMKRWTEN